MRCRGVHVVNQPFGFEAIYALFKPFLSEKLRRKVNIENGSSSKVGGARPGGMQPRQRPSDGHYFARRRRSTTEHPIPLFNCPHPKPRLGVIPPPDLHNVAGRVCRGRLRPLRRSVDNGLVGCCVAKVAKTERSALVQA